MKDKLTTIAIHTYSRALMLKTQLESAGIDCSLTGVNIVQPSVGGGVKLKVRNIEVAHALKIIEAIKEESGRDKEKTVKQMQRIRRILVPVDFSDYSLNACRYAIGLAEKFKAEVKLFHAHFKPILDIPAYEGSHMYQLNYDKYFEEIEIRARRNITELKDLLKKEITDQKITGVTLSYSLGSGFADEAIMDFCEKYNPGLVVIGTHGVAEKTEGIFGSVAAKLIDRLNVPLLAVPASASYKGLDKVKNGLYATDFDENDVIALHKLIHFIRPFKMHLHCVHISIGRKKPWDPVKMESLQHSFKEDFPGQKLTCNIMVSDDVLIGLETYMRNNNVGLIAFNTHKHSLFAQLFTTSITRNAIKRFNKPVFIFQSK
ncbi:MAG: universal stress protein [Bacteroidales bacterium]|nr:universal stress protein [Bacteroidales bacterium]MDZ4205221.1 universal stress protein [Bacteroidales bacterium]